MPGAALPTAPSIPTAPVTSAVLDRLRAIVGEQRPDPGRADKQPFVTDWRGTLAGQAAAVVRPASTAEVSAVVKLCYDNGIAIVPQGGNTGLMAALRRGHAPRHRAVARAHEPVLNVDPVGYA